LESARHQHPTPGNEEPEMASPPTERPFFVSPTTD